MNVPGSDKIVAQFLKEDAEAAFPRLPAVAAAVDQVVKEADEDWEKRGKKEFARQIYGNAPVKKG